jgi:hypothetical protein
MYIETYRLKVKRVANLKVSDPFFMNYKLIKVQPLSEANYNHPQQLDKLRRRLRY